MRNGGHLQRFADEFALSYSPPAIDQDRFLPVTGEGFLQFPQLSLSANKIHDFPSSFVGFTLVGFFRLKYFRLKYTPSESEKQLENEVVKLEIESEKPTDIPAFPQSSCLSLSAQNRQISSSPSPLRSLTSWPGAGDFSSCRRFSTSPV